MYMLPQLSLDIEIEIIKRLPVRSLIQFRSVCKAWKSSIDSSHFIAGYNVPPDQPQQHHLMISYKEEKEVKYVCFVDDDTFPQQKFFPTVPHLARDATVVGGSSHGLLCLTRYLQKPDDTSITQMAVNWNPAIRKSIAVVVPNDVAQPNHLFGSVIGFGVCPDTKDPKLVSITYPNAYESHLKAMVFTLSSGEWTTLCSNHLPRGSLYFDSSCQTQTVIGQFIYWLVTDEDALDGEFYLIMSFDLSTNEFKQVHLPATLSELSHPLISRLRESLVVLDYKLNSTMDQYVCDVWMMMMEHGDPKTVTKLFTIKAPYASIERILGFRNNGELIIGMLYDDDQDFFIQCALVVYEPFLEHIKNLGIRGNRYSLYGSSYTESLLLLDHDDGHIVKCGAVKT